MGDPLLCGTVVLRPLAGRGDADYVPIKTGNTVSSCFELFAEFLTAL